MRQDKIGLPKILRRDRLTKQRRSWNMSRIRAKNTAPEIRVRSLLHSLGFRFRLHVRKLPGQPDVVLVKHKTVIFVHGCFWHRHKNCKNCTTPSNRREWWQAKLEGNAARDKRHQAALKKLGWRVVVIWECQTQNNTASRAIRRLRSDV
jgi:DNA mismatch endonuclease (patch repair protein)